MDKINVLIVEDDPMTKKLLEMFLHNCEKYTVVASIESAAIAEIYCTTNRIDLILMDVCTSLGASGLVAAEKIKKSYPKIKIIIITSMPEANFITRARNAGVDSFWYKEPNQENAIEVMNRTMEGESIYPEHAPVLKIGMATSEEFLPSELEVLRELTSGDTDEEIAKRLHLSPWTVRKYIKNMLEKTDFKSRTQLAIAAKETGIVIRGY